MRAMVETRARQARLHLGIGLAAVILLAALVRLTGLTKEPFWLDEVCSFDFSAGSADQILQVNARDVTRRSTTSGSVGGGESQAARKGC
jgi:hypothetical protein